MDNFTFKQDAAGYRSTVDPNWLLLLLLLLPLGVVTRVPVGRFEEEGFAPWSPYRSKVRLTKARRRLDQRVEHRLQIERRAADDFEHLGSSGLLLKGFPQFVEQPRV